MMMWTKNCVDVACDDVPVNLVCHATDRFDDRATNDVSDGPPILNVACPMLLYRSASAIVIENAMTVAVVSVATDPNRWPHFLDAAAIDPNRTMAVPF